MTDEDIFHLGIKVIIVNSEGRVLLLLRSPVEANGSAPWDIPGGRKQRGEDIAKALERELYEETGLQIDGREVRFVGASLSSGRIPTGETDVGLILFVYRCKWDGIPQVRLSPGHSDFWWASPEEAGEALQSHIPPHFILAKEVS